MNKKVDKKKVKDVLKKIKKAVKEGNVVIANSAAKADKGEGAVRIWMHPKHEVFGIEYSIPGMGFGTAAFGLVDKTEIPDECPVGRLHVKDSEGMSREFIKKMLCRLVDEATWDNDEGMH